MTGSNLPPLDPRHRRNAPWNQDYREPTYICMHCGDGYERPNQHTVLLEEAVYVHHRKCPHCDNVVSAILHDETEAYLQSWREFPEEMHGTIESYAELREYDD